MPGFNVNRQTAGVAAAAAAAALAGLPAAAAAALRLKYGPTVFNDMLNLHRGRALARTFEEYRRSNVQLVDFFEEHARDRPEKPAVLYGDEVHTYGDLDVRANRLARFVRRGPAAACRETVAIFMVNEPSFLLSWLAFAKLGLKMAFLNCNLKGDVLLHCIKACNVKAIACGKDPRLLEVLAALQPDLEALGIVVWVLGVEGVGDQTSLHGFIPVDARGESGEPIPRSLRQDSASQDVALYIFTSGTTGMPKPARVTHYRLVTSSSTHIPSLAIREDDITYITLPLYHSAAFSISFAGLVKVGGTAVLSNFSARRFWDDVRRYRATIIPYIGEMCRYLLAQPPRPDDGKYSHTIRYALGNGLAPDIWDEFRTRFNIRRVHEFYGATEGTFALVNLDGKLGSVGRYPPLIKACLDVIVLVECNSETAEPLRGSDGKCIPTPTGETGLMLFRLTDRAQFDGYEADGSANDKKLVRNVRADGDLFFNTGDLMLLDAEGYLYFKDRLGDTFRWKSENVATTEVAQVLHSFPQVQDANVYGVRVAGHDGRAGMAAINLVRGRPLDPKSFYDHVVKSLPLYACPKFLRVMEQMDVTGTFKHKKTDLAREGFDLNVVADPLFFMDTEKKTYSPLDGDALRKIVGGHAKL